jgi:hypothetical protein
MGSRPINNFFVFYTTASKPSILQYGSVIFVICLQTQWYFVLDDQYICHFNNNTMIFGWFVWYTVLNADNIFKVL